jgi:hypothetical protein
MDNSTAMAEAFNEIASSAVKVRAEQSKIPYRAKRKT